MGRRKTAGVDVASEIGRTFRLFDWSGVTPDGTFATVQSDRPWDLSQLYTTGEATLLALAGDFNGNGRVDAADYVVWRNHLGGDESLLNGAGDNSGSVDVGDYVLWKSQYMTANSGLALAHPVPEPKMAVMAMLLLAAYPLWSRGKVGV